MTGGGGYFLIVILCWGAYLGTMPSWNLMLVAAPTLYTDPAGPLVTGATWVKFPPLVIACSSGRRALPSL